MDRTLRQMPTRRERMAPVKVATRRRAGGVPGARCFSALGCQRRATLTGAIAAAQSRDGASDAPLDSGFDRRLKMPAPARRDLQGHRRLARVAITFARRALDE